MIQAIYSLAATGSFCWFLTRRLWIYPHSLSYFNESIGGPLNGPKHLLGSNVDWGQGFRYLKWWHAGYSEVRPLYLAYYGYFDPRHVGIEFSIPSEVPDGESLKSLKPGWYVISTNFLEGYPWFAHDGEGGKKSYNADALKGLRRMVPMHAIGYSICVLIRGVEPSAPAPGSKCQL